MCTLTVISGNNSGKNSLVVTMNRDELRTRTEIGTLLTGRSKVSGVSYCYPLDSLHGGTWFGCNSAGIVLALLNRYQDKIDESMESRGLIIATLISCGSIAEMLHELQDGLGRNSNPHDLIIANADALLRWSWNGSNSEVDESRTPSPFMLSSSSMHTEHTLAKRKQMFHKYLAEHQHDGMNADQILTHYHLLQDSADPSGSILMSRQHSHTKSIVQARLSDGAVEVVYLNEATLRELPAGTAPDKLPVHRLSRV